MTSSLDALRAETLRGGEFLASLDPADWARPTRCPPMTVLELSAHAGRGAGRIKEMIAAGPVDAEPEKDGATYFRFDSASEGAAIVARAKEAAAGLTPERAAAEWARQWADALDAAGETLAASDPVLPNVFGLIRLSEYLRTRVVEVTIHLMDVRDALSSAPDPTAEGLTVTCDVLRDLLGTDPRTLGIDDERFALTATGRETLSDREREVLGPLADAFPLFA